MKSKMKRRMLAIVLCMVIALSNSSFIFASSGTEEPAAVVQEGDPQNVQETQTEAAVQDTPAVLSETTPEATPEATPEPTQVPEVTAAPTEAPQATVEPTQVPEVTAAPEATPAPTETPAVTAEPTQAPEITPTPTPEVTAAPEATPVPTEAPVTYNEAVELRHEFKDENGNVTATVTAQIPAGAFQGDASELTMEVTVPDQATAEHVKKLMEESLPEHYMLGDTVFYDIRFKVNGTETESQQPIVITFENQNGITVKDVKKAVVFQLDPADPAVEGDKDELVTITQRNDMIESLQNSGQSTDNVDDYDLSEITLKEDGTSNKIQMEGRTSTIYGCYAYYEPVQVLTYEDDQVTVTVSAAENGVIPANAELKVVPITEDKETEDQYKDVEKKLQEKAEEEEYEIAGFLAYDITFVDPDGNETEPNGEVKVSMDYKKAAIPESVSEEDAQNAEVTVMHLEEDENGDVAQVVDMAQVDQMDLLEKTDDQKIQKVEVKTESFSTFTITWTTTGTKITIHYVNRNYQEIAAEGIQDITISDNETIDISKYKKTISNYSYSEATIGRNGSTIYSVRVDESGQLQYKTSYWSSWNNWTSDLGYHVYLKYNSTGDYATIETVDNVNENITLNLFNYDVNTFKEFSWYDSHPTSDNGYNRGINRNHDFKFLSNATDPNLALYNKYTNGKKVRFGIVKDKLDDGYPVLKDRDQSLAYLFDNSQVEGKTAYFDVNYLFTKDENGYFSFDSDMDAAKFDGSEKFTVYDKPESGFFPFDQKKVTSTGAGEADHYFGLTMSANFYYPKDGKINGNDMVFEFSGDDDVWVFIDDKLVLDLGGIHGEVTGSINFATGRIDENGQETKDLFEIIEDISEPYSNHKISFFYLERGNSDSNCMLKFNLPTIPENSVMVTKEVTDESGMEVNYADNINYQFNITRNGNVIAKQSYDIWEDDQKIGIGITDANGNFTLKHGQSAVFSGFSANDKYVVKETAAYLEDGYEVEVTDGSTTIETEDEDGTVTDIYQSVSTGELIVYETPSVVFKNKVKKTGTLSIIKKIEGEGDDQKEFEIEVKINGVLYKGSYQLNGETKQAENGRIRLRANETITINGFPYGTTFEVKEILDGSYLPTYAIDEEGGIYDSAVPSEENELSSAQGKIAAGGTVTITNKKVVVENGTTQVTVKKTWAEEQKYSDLIPDRIEIQLYEDCNRDGKYDAMDKLVEKDANGKPITPEVDLKKDGWTYTWSNLPADKDYVITESYPDGFKWETTEYSNTISNLKKLNRVTKCSNTSFNLGKNNMLLVKKTNNDGYFLWSVYNLGLTDTQIEQIAQEIMSMNLEGSGNLNLDNLEYDWGITEEDHGIQLTETASGWNLKFDKTSVWSQFWNFQYDRTENVQLINTIKINEITSLKVNKEWYDGEYGFRPKSITVKLIPTVTDTEGNETILEELKGIDNTSITLEQDITGEMGWTYTYENLPYYYYNVTNDKYMKISYSVKETKINGEEIPDPSIPISGYLSEVVKISDKEYTVKNIYVTSQWKIKKVSSTDKTLPLGGARFTLTKINEGQPEPEPKPSYYGISDDFDGTVCWWNSEEDIEAQREPLTYLSDGKYVLEETQAPVGYQKSDIKWYITIEEYQLKSITDENGNSIPVSEQSTRAAEEAKTYLYENTPLYDLPSAGGSGIFWYLISGTAFLMAASLILYRMKRKEVLGK